MSFWLLRRGILSGPYPSTHKKDYPNSSCQSKRFSANFFVSLKLAVLSFDTFKLFQFPSLRHGLLETRK